MAAKKNNYINAELDWAEDQLKKWKKYIDDNAIDELKDRKDGNRLIATKEVQGKYIQELTKNYLQLLEVVDKLREQEEMKQTKIRGDEDLSPLEDGQI